MKLVEKLLNYYKENTEDFVDDIEELDDWNDCLYEDRIFPMDEFDDVFQNINPSDILSRAFYGYDEPTDKNEQRQPFNPNREFFYFNGYGNLVSTNKINYNDYLNDYFIQDIIDNKEHLGLSEGAQELIDNYEDENE